MWTTKFIAETLPTHKNDQVSVEPVAGQADLYYGPCLS
jgi:hypothetical protein